MEWQAQEISIMLLGFPAQVKPSDDDAAHLQSLQGFIEAEIQQQKPIDPKFARLALGHIQGHLQGLDQKKNPNLNQIRQQVAPLIDYLEQLAKIDTPPMPQNVIPGPGAAPSSQEQPEQPTVTDLSKVQVDKSKIQSDRVSDAVAVADAVANLIKAGVEVSVADVNKVLTDLNLPPINSSQTPAVPPEVHQQVKQPPQAASNE
jgi:hypothetical protein